MTATIFDIKRSSFVDGPGIRTTVFFKGCDLRCKWCHSPESQSPDAQIMFYSDKCTGCGRCKDLTVNNSDFICYHGAKEICGREYTVDEVFDVILRDKVFYDSSGGGVTFSGGECMLRIDFLEAILRKCRGAGIHTALDTAGNAPWESFERIIPYTDLFLYDVKCISDDRHTEGTGVSNKQILDNLKKLSDESSCEIMIRIPVVPGFNSDDGEMQKISRFIKGIRHKSVELLPYHSMGNFKYEALGRDFTEYDEPGADEIDRLQNLIK